MPSDPSTGPLARTRDHVVRMLNHAFEEEIVLSTTMRDILGRITGPHSLHRLFGDHCRQIDQWLTEIGDRARAFGVPTPEAARPAKETAAAADARPAPGMIGELLALHEGIARRLRDELAEGPADATTSSLVGRLVDFHETTAWMLRMLLDGPEVPPFSA